MADVVVEQRVTNLEEAMADLAQTVARTSASVDRLSLEMREFKEEMREFKEESRLSREKSEANLQAWRDKSDADLQTWRDKSGADLQTWRDKTEADLQTWRDKSAADLQAWRDKSEADLQAYREKSESDLQTHRAEQQAMRRELNQKLGEIANKMGTLAEDLVAPSLPRILHEVVTCPDRDTVSMAVRVRRFLPDDRGQSQQYDVIASCGEYALFNETKTTLRPGDIDRLIEKLAEARAYFPEYEGMKITGSLASLYVDPSLVTRANRQGMLVLATGDELMDVLNEPGLQLREF